MKILSLNAWGGRVFEPLMDYLGAHRPDILCLQEVVHTPSSHADWLTYRDTGVELPQRANLLSDIKALYRDYQVFFAPMARGPLHEGEATVPSEFGLATFVHPDLAVIGQIGGFIHGRFSHDGWGPHPRSRNAIGLRLFDYRSERALSVMQLHGLRDPAGKGDTEARMAQSGAICAMARQLLTEQGGLVLCGDFNLLPESRTFADLRAIGLTDLVTANGYSDTRTSLYAKHPRFADYMLVTDDLDVSRFEIVAEPEVSDHRPLLLELGEDRLSR